jgi:hypothetical protein
MIKLLFMSAAACQEKALQSEEEADRDKNIVLLEN